MMALARSTAAGERSNSRAIDDCIASHRCCRRWSPFHRILDTDDAGHVLDADGRVAGQMATEVAGEETRGRVVGAAGRNPTTLVMRSCATADVAKPPQRAASSTNARSQRIASP